MYAYWHFCILRNLFVLGCGKHFQAQNAQKWTCNSEKLHNVLQMSRHVLSTTVKKDTKSEQASSPEKEAKAGADGSKAAVKTVIKGDGSVM